MPLGTFIPSLSTTTFCRALEDHSSTTAPRKLLTVDASRMDHSSHFAAIARFHHLLRGSFPLMLLCSASSPHSGNEYRGIPRSCEQLASRPVRSVVNNLILFNFFFFLNDSKLGQLRFSSSAYPVVASLLDLREYFV